MLKQLLKTKAGQALVLGLLRLNARRQGRNNIKETDTMADLNAIFTEMKTRFNADAAAGTDAVFQYVVDGDTHWSVAVADSECQIAEGTHDAPTVTLNLDSTTLTEVMSGELDGMQAFMSGRIQADGNIMEATKLALLFPVR
ncbi:SCP2 sterol-binding domain-containing protein [Marinobacterium jannaschii]|uniref:SCP2 sterol-binding domain-containing protein n=1 Tax=Marinobacterium jannaschii TaxID=64970 RepID=UPI000AC29333|nr:SCP2 sterol-binding domain-containing protein [Marinobacterium jannaschii]